MTAKLLTILTGINRTAAPSSGSTILVHDLYGEMPEIRTIFLGRAPVDQAWKAAFDQLVTLSTTKRPHGPDFDPYVDELTREVGALIKKTQPNAIHAQHLGFALSLAFTRAAGNVPIIAIARGPDVMAAERSAWECELLREVAAASAAIVAPTSALADRIDRLTGRRFTDRLTVIPWGIPLCGTRVSDQPPIGTGPLSVVHAGRLDANKSTITAIEAIAVSGQPHRLTIIGMGTEEDALRERACSLGIQDRVAFAPFLPRQELWQRLPEFDAFVFTTSGSEAFGLVAVEAQAHGLPVVYSKVAGMAETLGQAGIPYTAGDPASLASALDQLARDVHWRKALIRAGLVNSRRYDITHTARRVADLTIKVASAAPG
ncbi:glycosyltransferase family 4 protein [Nonomuraea pusilla]|uniref:Glycosyl transferases group 1 n=1 Tax=Nonomuraea pusilla TaxID=46177 RepID=A0A1H8JSS1_9ACTN|nr:glycosyltransferase family 4 protein [Nonomuraea pusilla]SEN83248.1 Glycosyl transferases group 1 [Nonomuraea pusilla]